MSENKKLSEKFSEVLQHEGVVSIVSWGVETHVANKLTLVSKDVLGYKDYPGTGFVINGTSKYITSGDEYDFMKQKFSFLTRVLEITVETAKQML